MMRSALAVVLGLLTLATLNALIEWTLDHPAIFIAVLLTAGSVFIVAIPTIFDTRPIVRRPHTRWR